MGYMYVLFYLHAYIKIQENKIKPRQRHSLTGGWLGLQCLIYCLHQHTYIHTP